MKFFAVFACVVAAVAASPATWNLSKLSNAIDSPATDPALKPVLESALNIVMDKIFAGENVDSILIKTTGGVAGTYTLAQLDYALSHATPLVKPYLAAALDTMMESLWTGHSMETIDVELPSFDLSYWSLHELDLALSTPGTDAALVPYLEQGLNELMAALFAGQSVDAIVVATPAQAAAPVVPTPAVDSSVSPVDAPTEVAVPVPALTPSNESPLVQIILNVNSSSQPQANQKNIMVVPTVTIDELSNAITDPTTPPTPKKVLEGILNDYMDLQYGKETPYTTGKQVLPEGTTIEDVETAASDVAMEKKFRDIFTKISETFKSGDLTPQSPVDGWDPKYRPVLVVVRPNN